MLNRSWRAIVAGSLATILTPLYSASAAPSAQDALKLSPIQKDVDYYVPTTEDAAKATIKAEKIGSQTGWVVRRSNGEVIRQFIDTNSDNVVDRWCYFKDGFEVYRDIDENFNGKADQYRWLNAGGSRWGLDKDEDGKIDSWKVISAEEASAEVVMALRDLDPGRFNCLLMTASELRTLGLGKEKAKDIADRIANAPSVFKDIMSRQKVVSNKSTWTSFAAARPGLVPQGTSESTADILVYQDAIAMVETGKEQGQVPIGMIVKVGDTWRLVDVPAFTGVPGKFPSTAFNFYPNNGLPPDRVGGLDQGATESAEQMQALIKEIDELDNELRVAGPEKAARLNDQRATLQEKLADTVGEKERDQFLKQLADSLTVAVQGGGYPAGVERLNSLYERLVEKKEDTDVLAYVKFRHHQARYANALSQATEGGPNAKAFPDVQKEWLDDLKGFIKDFPKSPDTAEALLQLGIAEEFAGQTDRAKAYYNEIVTGFEGSAPYKKAEGAVRRLDCVGKPIPLQGKSINSRKGEVIDLAKLRGKVVLIHYWATWCEPCKADFAQLKEMKAKYGKSGFELIGVNLDSQAESVDAFLAKNTLPWPQLFLPGGLDSPYANSMGILTLPTMILVDAKGNVVNRGIHVTELDNELRNQLK